MTHDEICKLALEVAEKSTCKKRKVGAVIVDSKGHVLASGSNYLPYGYNCEDSKHSSKVIKMLFIKMSITKVKCNDAWN